MDPFSFYTHNKLEHFETFLYMFSPMPFPPRDMTQDQLHIFIDSFKCFWCSSADSRQLSARRLSSSDTPKPLRLWIPIYQPSAAHKGVFQKEQCSEQPNTNLPLSFPNSSPTQYLQIFPRWFSALYSPAHQLLTSTIKSSIPPSAQNETPLQPPEAKLG